MTKELHRTCATRSFFFCRPLQRERKYELFRFATALKCTYSHVLSPASIKKYMQLKLYRRCFRAFYLVTCQVRHLRYEEEVEKRRVLEDALHVLATEHHALECSVGAHEVRD